MKTFQFFLIFLIFSFIVNHNFDLLHTEEIKQGQCVNRVWGVEGDECVQGFNSTKTCKAFLACRNGKCVKAHIGAKCTQDQDCFLYNPLYSGTRCVTNKCIKPRYNGLPCSDNRHCFSNECKSGVCYGAPYDASCDPTKLSCGQGLYCSRNERKCRYQLLANDYCSDYYMDEKPDYEIPHGSNFNVICAGGLKCSGPAGSKYCMYWKTGLSGDACIQERDGDDGCEFGLRCSRRRQQCVYEDEFETWPCPGAGKNCTYANEEECVCVGGGRASCERVYDLNRCNFNYVANRMRDCIASYNCAYERNVLWAMEVNILDTDTCIGKYCSAEVLSTVCCAFDKYKENKYSPAGMPPFCSTSNPVLAVFLVLLFLCLGAIILGAVLILVAAGVYFLVKRRNSSSNSVYSTGGGFENLD